MRGRAIAIALMWSASLASAQVVSVSVTTSAASVPFGEAFPVTIERRYSRDLVAEAWSADAFAPLPARTVGRERRVEGEVVVEVVSTTVRAFTRGKVVVPAVAFRAATSDGAEELVASSEPLELSVTSVLAADDAGVAELPGDLMSPPLDWTRWLVPFAGVAAALLVGSWFLTRMRRDASGPLVDPWGVARQRLSALERPGVDADIAHVQGWYLSLSDVVRDLIEGAHGVRAPGMTSEQFVTSEAVLDALGEQARRRLGAFLLACDPVKFGRLPTTEAQRAEAQRAAEEFVGAAAFDPGEEAVS